MDKLGANVKKLAVAGAEKSKDAAADFQMRQQYEGESCTARAAASAAEIAPA